MEYSELATKFPHLFSNQSAALRIITNVDEIGEWQKHKREQLRQSGKSSEWANIGVVFDDPFFVILRDLVEFPGGFRNGYVRLYARTYLEGGAAIVVILPEMDGKLLLIRQFRHATRSWHWEIPRGFGEVGIDSISQAIIELREEVDGVISEIVDLGDMYHNAAFDGNPVNLFLTRMISIGKSQVEEGISETQWISVSKLEEMIADGEITDGFTIAAYTRAKLKGLI